MRGVGRHQPSSLIRRMLARASLATVLGALLFAASAHAGTVSLMSCSEYRDPGLAWQPNITQNLGADNACAVGRRFQLLQTGYARTGESANWVTISPPAIGIIGAATPAQSVVVDPNEGVPGYYTADFYWHGGHQEIKPTSKCCGGLDYGSGIFRGDLSDSHYFGFSVTCSHPLHVGPPPYRCAASNPGEVLGVGGIVVVGQENVGPRILALGSDNLYYAGGRWVRGAWQVAFSASDDSGVCHSKVYVNYQVVDETDSTPYHGSWHQCPDQNRSPAVDTAQYGQGAMVLEYSATNAAGVSSSAHTTVYVDNQPVGLSLSGPTDALSTAGTQDVTAAATAGPSGVGIACSVDGSGYQWYPEASVQIPVAGVGVHKLTCYSANNARDAAGNVATSAPETWTLSIRQPTVSGIGFAKLVDALLCRRVRARVEVPSHWVTVRRHHRLVRVKRRARGKLVRVTRCHPRIVRRKIAVWTTVRRHGKEVRVKREKTIRVVVFPHVVTRSARWVGHGRRTTVNGWLGMPDGTALGGQSVRVLTAPDNGLGQFTQAAVVTTAADGSWSAQLAPGPSRLVEAAYDGAATLEPSLSGQVHVIVPAKVKLISILPRRVAWGGTVRIVGQLEGGYLPPGGALVRLRIGIGSAYTTYGVEEHVTGNGRFSTTYTFGVGDPSVFRSFWFQIASLPMGNYPFSPADSGRRTVPVGGHPSIPRAHHRRPRRKRRR